MKIAIELLKKIPLRWWIYIGAAVALAGVAWREHHQTHRANDLAAKVTTVTKQRDQVRADFDAYKATAAADLKLSRETSHALQAQLSDIDHSRRPISVLCQSAAAARLPSEGGAAGGSDAATERGSAAPPLRDIGSALEDVRIEAQRNNAAHVKLEQWERARTH